MRNKLPPLENYINGSNIVEGLPVTYEILNKQQVYNQLEGLQPIIENQAQQQVWEPNVAVAVKNQQMPENVESKPIPFICQYVGLTLLDFILFGEQIFIQFLLLGNDLIYSGLIFSYGQLMLSSILVFLAEKCQFANLLIASGTNIISFWIMSTICFVCEIIYPVRYQFQYPEANNAIRAYDDIFNQQKNQNENDESSNKEYWLSDICKALEYYYGSSFREQSYAQYCYDLLQGNIKENNLNNLTTLQKGLYQFSVIRIVYFVAALLSNFIIVYYLGKITYQRLDYLKKKLKCYPEEKVNDFFGFIDEHNAQKKKIPKKPPFLSKKKRKISRK